MPKVSHKVKDQYVEELLAVFQKAADSKESIKDFLTDLLTPEEFEHLALRWQILKKLFRGISQRRVSRDLKVSIATITRGSRVLRNKYGGVNKMLQKF